MHKDHESRAPCELFYVVHLAQRLVLYVSATTGP